MRTPSTTTNAAQTVFGWLVTQETRLHRRLQLMRARQALGRAFTRFAAAHPRLAASLFDAHFVETRVAPLLAQALERGQRLRPEAIAGAWLAVCRGPAADRAAYDLSSLTAAAAELLDLLDADLSPAHAPAPGEDDAALFAAAVAADSNRELDWLWLATRVGEHEQRRFCYEKALYINPHCEAARRGLAELSAAEPAPRRELALGEA